MTVTEPLQSNEDEEELTTFLVFGLYRDQRTPKIVQAVDKAVASRMYHDANPGWDGTVYKIQSLSEVLTMEPADG